MSRSSSHRRSQRPGTPIIDGQPETANPAPEQNRLRPSRSQPSVDAEATTTPRTSRRVQGSSSTAGGEAASRRGGGGGDGGGGFAWDAAESALVQGPGASAGEHRRNRTSTPLTTSTADTNWEGPEKSAQQEIDELRRKNQKLQKKVNDGEQLRKQVDQVVDYFEEREESLTKQVEGLEEAEAEARTSAERYASEFAEIRHKEAKVKRELRHLKSQEAKEREDWQEQLRTSKAQLQQVQEELEAERAHGSGPMEPSGAARPAEEKLAMECADLRRELQESERREKIAVEAKPPSQEMDLLRSLQSAEAVAYRAAQSAEQVALAEAQEARSSNVRSEAECTLLRQELSDAEEKRQQLQEQLLAKEEAPAASPPVQSAANRDAGPVTARALRWATLVFHADIALLKQSQADSIRTLATSAVSSNPNAAASKKLMSAEQQTQMYAAHAMTMHEVLGDDLQRRAKLCERWSHRGSALQALQQEILEDTERYRKQSRSWLASHRLQAARP